MGLFRWGMGGGYGRPFFMAMAQTKKYAAVTIAMPTELLRRGERPGRRPDPGEPWRPPCPCPTARCPNQCRCRFQKYIDRREDEQGRRFRYRTGERLPGMRAASAGNHAAAGPPTEPESRLVPERPVATQVHRMDALILRASPNSLSAARSLGRAGLQVVDCRHGRRSCHQAEPLSCRDSSSLWRLE